MVEEERKKQKLQELQKKKEEQDKKNKKVELKKKKVEEEMKKMLEEEIEKKKVQRKALEESFWTRVKARQKEKQPEKSLNKLEESKLPSIFIPNDRIGSVEPVRTVDETLDKSRLMRTQIFNTPQNATGSGKATTFTSFFKDELTTKHSPARLLVKKISAPKESRQKSVEDVRPKKKEREDGSFSLPYIESSTSKQGKTPNEVSSL